MKVKEDKILGYLGLATKAGQIVSGEFMTEKAIKEGNAKVVIVAQDASDNTKEMFRNKCEYYNVPIYIFGDKDKIGHAMGKQFRASVAITDDGFAKAIKKQFEVK